ncbi:hypothetical protein ACKFKG_13980 [Phormidesmis sp. 146-35]
MVELWKTLSFSAKRNSVGTADLASGRLLDRKHLDGSRSARTDGSRDRCSTPTAELFPISIWDSECHS